MSIRLLTALALLSGLTAFAPVPPPEATTNIEAELVAVDEDDKCIWISPTRRYCPDSAFVSIP